MTDSFRLHSRLTALLVDGDNISPARADEILERLGGAGLPEVRRVYGNIALTKGWASRPGFRTIHSGEGKNATDLLISIEAMDLLHQGRLGRLVLVSSDGDFTHLAHRLREEGIEVVGMGEEKTPRTMRAACTKFVLLPAPAAPSTAPAPAPAVVAAPTMAIAPATGQPPQVAPPVAKTKPHATIPAVASAQPVSAGTMDGGVAPRPAAKAAGPGALATASAIPTAAARPAPDGPVKGHPAKASPQPPAAPQSMPGRASVKRHAEVTALARALLQGCPDPRGVALTKLGPRLHQALRVTLKELGASSWHGWFAAQPRIFTCDPKGADCHVRLTKG